MAGRNGVAALPRARAPIVLRHETINVPIEREDGETVVFAFYVKGPGCPITALIAVDEALASLEENEPTEEEAGQPARGGKPAIRGTLSPRRYLAKLNHAERTLRREMLQATSKEPLSLEDANLLATDGGPWKDILVDAGWRQSDEALDQADVEADDDPEALAGQSTGRTDSPASASPIQAVTPS